MRRTLVSLCLLALLGVGAGCSSDNANSGNTGGANSASSNATRNGVIETNANVSQKPEMNPSNTATVVNDNGNKNTAGISSMNNNTHGGNMNSANSNKGNSNKH
jgi:hypothetical protein